MQPKAKNVAVQCKLIGDALKGVKAVGNHSAAPKVGGKKTPKVANKSISRRQQMESTIKKHSNSVEPVLQRGRTINFAAIIKPKNINLGATAKIEETDLEQQVSPEPQRKRGNRLSFRIHKGQ